MTLQEKVEKFQAMYQDGLSLLQANKDAEAMKVFYEAATFSPEGWLSVAIQLVKDGQHDLALARLREVLSISKAVKIRAAAMTNIGLLLSQKGQINEAKELFRESMRLWPEMPDSYHNIALVSKWQGNLKESLHYSEMALSKFHWHEQAQFIHAMALLLDGQYLKGFEEYECRWRTKSFNKDDGFKLQKIYEPQPEWDGTNGKRLLIYGEQGHGDTILMLRYAKEIRKLGLWQAWVAQKSISPLMKTIPEIDQVVEVGEQLPDFDCHIPSVSLPRIFKTTLETIPPSPYIIKPEPFDYGEGFHVGICWRGSKIQVSDNIRSTNLADWSPLFDVPGITLHSLQVDFAEEALLYPQIKTYEKPKDWLETANRVAGLDLVVSVDTSIIHLSGSMGIPCLCAMHRRPYFVYPFRCGDCTPWYSSVKLFRAEKDFDWKPVFERIANDIQRLPK